MHVGPLLRACLPLGLAVAQPPADGLAPLVAGVASSGEVADLVIRPEGVAGGCRLLVSDAQTDAPVIGATLTLQRFGRAGQPPLQSSAAPGRFDGHYLAPCPAPEEALLVELVSASPGSELFALSWPAAATGPAPPPVHHAGLRWRLVLFLVLVVYLIRWRRWLRPSSGQGLRSLALLALPLIAGDAAAHGPAGDALPAAPGAEVALAQELQFALGFRTAAVSLEVFPAPDSSAAPRTSPSVERSAVVERDGQKLVFVRTAPETFAARQVTLGWTSGPRVAVESGLAPGDLALVAGGAFLRNGGAAALPARGRSR